MVVGSFFNVSAINSPLYWVLIGFSIAPDREGINDYGINTSRIELVTDFFEATTFQ